MSESDGNSNAAPVEDEKMKVDGDEDTKKLQSPVKTKLVKDEEDDEEDDSEEEEEDTKEGGDEKDGDYRDEGARSCEYLTEYSKRLQTIQQLNRQNSRRRRPPTWTKK
ncbi:unnamed protein product [Sphagnum balticum]